MIEISNLGSLRSYITRIRRLLFSRTKLVMYKYSMEEMGAAKRKGEEQFTYRQFKPEDYPEFEKLLLIQRNKEQIFRPVDGAEVEDRLKKGHFLFICENNSKIVGYAWFAANERYLPEIDATIKFREGEAYAYNAYVMKEFRGHNTARNLLITGARILHPQGFTGILVAAINWNIASRKTLEGLGFWETGYYLTGRFCFLRFLLVACRDVSLVTDACMFHVSRKFSLGIFHPLKNVLRKLPNGNPKLSN